MMGSPAEFIQRGFMAKTATKAKAKPKAIKGTGDPKNYVVCADVPGTHLAGIEGLIASMGGSAIMLPKQGTSVWQLRGCTLTADELLELVKQHLPDDAGILVSEMIGEPLVGGGTR